MNLLMQLRKVSLVVSDVSFLMSAVPKLICSQKAQVVNHPFMFQEADTDPLVTDESIITSSAKMMVLDRLLTKLKYAKKCPIPAAKRALY